MHSLRFLVSRRWILLALSVVVLSYLAYWLGQWQFHRLADRQERNTITERNEVATPRPASEVLSGSHGVAREDEWRLVTATGTYRPDDTVLVRYQTRDGQLGVDVVVPLETTSGAILLVDRGWFAANDQQPSPAAAPPPPPGEVTVTGWVRADATGDSTQVTDSSTRAISSRAIGASLGLTCLRGFVDLKTEDPPAADPLQVAELPDLGNGPHFFYGLQWWFFGLLAVGGFCYLAVDEWRRTTGRKPGPGGSGRRVTRSAGGRRPRGASRP